MWVCDVDGVYNILFISEKGGLYNHHIIIAYLYFSISL